MIDPAKVCLFIPGELKKFKLDLFNRIGEKIKAHGGRTIRGDHQALDQLPDEIVPIVGAAPYLLPLVEGWRSRGRPWVGWDRGYCRRVFATWLPRGDNGGFYRWHVNSYQMMRIRDVPGDRWDALKTPVTPWRKKGRHIVLALPTPTYTLSHPGVVGWTERTLARLKTVTDRKIVIRDKESKKPLQDDIDGAHALVAHGSIAAVEAVIMGCPVFVDRSSAAALVGQTDLNLIETPVYPNRDRWLRSLAFSQFSEAELVDGTLFRLLV